MGDVTYLIPRGRGPYTSLFTDNGGLVDFTSSQELVIDICYVVISSGAPVALEAVRWTLLVYDLEGDIYLARTLCLVLLL